MPYESTIHWLKDIPPKRKSGQKREHSRLQWRTLQPSQFCCWTPVLQTPSEGSNGNWTGVEGVEVHSRLFHKGKLPMSHWTKKALGRRMGALLKPRTLKTVAEEPNLKQTLNYNLWPSVSLPPLISVLLTVAMHLWQRKKTMQQRNQRTPLQQLSENRTETPICLH